MTNVTLLPNINISKQTGIEEQSAGKTGKQID